MPLLRLVIPLAVLLLVACIASQIDLDTLGAALAQVPPGHVAMALLLVQAQIVLSGLRWRFTAGRLGQFIGPRTAIAEYYVASLLNQSLPGGVAGDIARACRTRTVNDVGWKASAKAVLYERLSGQTAFVLFALLGMLFWPQAATGGGEFAVLPLAVSGIALAALAAGLAFRKSGFGGGGFAADMHQIFVARGAWLVQGGLSLAVMASYIAVFAIASDAIGAPLSVAALMTAIPLSLIAMLIPTGFGGWGTREAAAMMLWPLVGHTAALGLAASLVYGAVCLVGSAPGLAVLAATALRGKG